MSFLKKLFGGQKSKNDVKGSYIVVTLNDKIMPIDRGEVYEDPLEEILKSEDIGEVTGGGTMQLETGEIDFCDLEIFYKKEIIDNSDIEKIIRKLEELGAPKGSKLTIEKTDQVIEFGKKEGLGIYLDGINLSDDVYKNSDSAALAFEICKLTGIENQPIRYWQGNTETGLYFYSDSFEKMKESIKDFVNNHPECKNCRIERIG